MLYSQAHQEGRTAGTVDACRCHRPNPENVSGRVRAVSLALAVQPFHLHETLLRKKQLGKGSPGSNLVGCVKPETGQKPDAEERRSSSGAGKPAAGAGGHFGGWGATTGSRPTMVSDVLAAISCGGWKPGEFSEFTEHPFVHPCSYLLCFIKNVHDKISQGKGERLELSIPAERLCNCGCPCTTPCYVTCESV